MQLHILVASSILELFPFILIWKVAWKLCSYSVVFLFHISFLANFCGKSFLISSTSLIQDLIELVYKFISFPYSVKGELFSHEIYF
jgi:hypothetical protein